MLHFPPEIVNYIFSYLPILSDEDRIIHSIIKNYNHLLLNELKKKERFDLIYTYWLDINPPIKQYISEDNLLTLVQIRQLYKFCINYGELIKDSD